MSESAQATFLRSFSDLDALQVADKGEMLDTVGFYAKVEYPRGSWYRPKLDAHGKPDSVALVRTFFYPSQRHGDGSAPLVCDVGRWHPRDADRAPTRMPRLTEWCLPIDLDFTGFRMRASGVIADEDGREYSGGELFSHMLAQHSRTSVPHRWMVYAAWRAGWIAVRQAASLIAKTLEVAVWFLGGETRSAEPFGFETRRAAEAAADTPADNRHVGVGQTLSVFGYDVPRRLALMYFVLILALGVASYFWLYEWCPSCYRLAKGVASINLLALASAVLGVTILNEFVRPVAIWLTEWLYRHEHRLLFWHFKMVYYRVAAVLGGVLALGCIGLIIAAS